MTKVLLDARMAIRGLGISTFVDRLMEGFGVAGVDDLTLWKGSGGWNRSGRLSTFAHSGLFDISPRIDPRTRGIDVVHYLSNTGSVFPGPRTVVTVHDLLYRSQQRWRDQLIGFLLERTLRRAARIVAVSDRTRSEVIRAFPQLAGRVDVIPHGMRRFPPPASERTHLLAFGGGSDLRKRTGLLIEVYREYRNSTRNPLPLIVLARAGLTGGQLQQLKGFGAKILPGADGAEVDRLLAGAAAVIYTTAREGFGLPILEAAEFCTPVVLEAAADVATEVLGRHCVRVDSTSPRAWAAAVRRAVADGPVVDPLDLCDWPEVASRYMGLYEQLSRRAAPVL